MKMTTYIPTPHISYVCILTLGYKIKSLTLLKQVKFIKQTHLCLFCTRWQSSYRDIGIVLRGRLMAVSD